MELLVLLLELPLLPLELGELFLELYELFLELVVPYFEMVVLLLDLSGKSTLHISVKHQMSNVFNQLITFREVNGCHIN